MAAHSKQKDQDKALEMALAQIDKQFGSGAVMKMGERTNMAIEVVPTGALALDLALGVGGLPRGRITEIYGPESSGKSTLAMHVVAEAQRNGGVCAYIDAEHAMDPVYASSDRRRRRPTPDLPARHRRAGARDLRHADPLRRDRRRGRSTRWRHSRLAPRSKARWATPTSACRPAS